MTIRFDKRAALVKIESSYGTDSVPTEGANAIRLMNGRITPFEGEVLEREELNLDMGQALKDLVGRHCVFEFDVELAGSGVAGTAPAFGPLLRGCGLAETIVADTSVAYTPVNAAFEGLSAYWFEGTNKTAFIGARGEVELQLDKMRKARLHFRQMGIFASEANATFPTPTLTAWQRALYATKANVPTFTIDGYAVTANSLKLRTGNAVRYLERINRQEIALDDRKPSWEAVIEDVAISTKNFRSLVNGAGVPLAVVLGTAAGNILTIAAASCQVQPFSESVDGVDTMITVPANILRGTPDFSLTFT